MFFIDFFVFKFVYQAIDSLKYRYSINIKRQC